MKNWKLVVMITILVGLFCVAPIGAASKDELKIAMWEDVSTLDPGWLASVAREFVIMDCIYDGLAKYKEGTWEVVPQLAESWEMSADGKEVTFHLRKGVQFHRGYGEMTAEDVKFTFDRMIDPDSDSTEKSHLAQFDRVEVIDKYTVKLFLKDPMAQLFTLTLPMNTGMIVCKKAVEEMGRQKFALNPVGCGPYELAFWKPKQKMALKAFKDYWGEKPKIDKVSFIPIIEDATCEIALKSGEIDIGRVSLLNVKAFKKNPRLSVITKPDLKYWWIGFTANKLPFDNLKLREALRYTLDVDKILLAAFYGAADRAITIVPPGVLGHWKEAPIYKPDLAKARQLLKEGGKPNGFKASVNLELSDTSRIIGEVIKADAAKIGIDLELNAHDSGAFNKANQAGQYNCFIDIWSAAIDPHYTVQWHTSDNLWNITHWSSATFDDLVKKGASELDLKKRAEIYTQMQKIMDKECFAIWLTHGVRVLAVQKSVNAGKIYPNGRLAPWAINFKK